MLWQSGFRFGFAQRQRRFEIAKIAPLMDNINTACNLLREASILLSEDSSSNLNVRETLQQANTRQTPQADTPNNANGIPSGNATVTSQSTTTSHPVDSGSAPSTSSSCTSTPMRSQQQVLSNFRALFSPYSRPLPLASTSRARGLPTSRRPAARANQAPKPESYTREMFCLASTSQNTTPNREEKEVLQRAGLGRMKIKFDARDNPQNFKEELEKTFGKLMWGGGFELLRRVPGNNLEVIQPPSVGYSVEHLKRCGLRQSMIFVRPIQSDLDLTPEDDFLGQGSSPEVQDYRYKL